MARLEASLSAISPAVVTRKLWQMLKPYFDTAGWQVEPLQPGRWYLALDTDSPISDRSLIECMEGRRQGNPDVRRFVSQLTEIQMLLHAAGVIPPAGHGLVFTGRSGAGKSTISGILRRAGGLVLSDDLVLIDASGERPQLRSTSSATA